MFRLCLSNRKKRATNKGELEDLTVNLRARYSTGRLRTQETGAIRVARIIPSYPLWLTTSTIIAFNMDNYVIIPFLRLWIYVFVLSNFPFVITKRPIEKTAPAILNAPFRNLLVFPFFLFWWYSHESVLLFCGNSFPHSLQYLLILLLLFGWQGIN